MSVICQTFVQNTWRSDLCSNCFKCLAEHSGGRGDRMNSTPRYMPQATSLYQSRGISSTLKWRLSEPIYERVARRDFGSQTPFKSSRRDLDPQQNGGRGILIKNPEKKIRSRPNVDFASEEALVIGYGGNDYDSDQSPWEMASDDDGSLDLDLLDDTDEDRKITRLTRNNTEFNASNANLLQHDNAPNNAKNNSLPKTPVLQSINNKNNNNNNNNGSPSKDKALAHLTYNDIQKKQDKKLNQYYFSSPTTTTIEPLRSYLHNTPGNVNAPKTHPDHPKVDNCKRSPDCQVLLSDNFSPLNTRTYSFVSEVSKNGHLLGSEHSSDSDYSTCRLTAGDSTDSESFQDAEESRMVPCSSFLHGSFPRGLSQPPLDGDKKYDGGSSTSGDVSNLSDDSDTLECQERTPYRIRNVRATPKTSPGEVRESDDTPPVSVQCGVRTVIEVSEKEGQDTAQAKEIESAPSNGSPQRSSIPATGRKQQSPETVTVEVVSPGTPEPNPAPKPPVDVNLRNIIAVNARSADHQSESPVCESPKSKATPTVGTAGGDDAEHRDNPQKQSPGSSPERSRPTPDPNRDLLQTPPSRDLSDDDYDRSPEAINNRQSKLAALALELELARRDSAMRSARAQPPALPPAPVEVRTRTSPGENYPIIKKNAPSCLSRLSAATLPDVLVPADTPTKTKKNRFSLKKLLKRNKDSGTFTPAAKEANPKAWKKQAFDRNRLSLEIVHPMDLAGDPLTSGDSTPTEEGQYMVSSHPGRGGYNRARSLSALPQLSGDADESGCSLLDCRKVDTLPSRKAGTVAERKKNRPSLVRTPSCSALPNRPVVTKDPPPKPPPPPKSKAMHPPPPPPPPHVPRISKPLSSPARPPPPKIPATRSRSQSGESTKDQSNADKEYANLGDIRSLLTPKKPQRPSAVSGPRDEIEGKRSEDIYETLKTEEEDHYTYLDEVKTSKSGSKESLSSFKSSGTACSRPWLDLQTSYAAIAAANYESLAEIITTSMNGSFDLFQNGGKTLKWKDFILETDTPQVALHDKCVYNALYKPQEKEIMLLVTPRKQSTPNARNLTRYPILASFTDNLPKSYSPNPSSPYMEWASVYVLHRSTVTTVQRFASSTSLDKGNQHVHLRNHCFVLLQLIHTLKSLQAEGIEEVNCDLDRLVLVTAHEDRPPVFVLFPEDKIHLTLCEGRKTLCQATLAALHHLLGIAGAEDLDSCSVNGERLAEPVAHTFKVIAGVLAEEKASSLSQAKGFLEYMLWGPVDVRVSDCRADLDTVLQRWLDLQRAQMVKSTIPHVQSSHLHVYEEYQLAFLLQASIKSLKGVISKL